MEPKFFITGSTGFIGGALCRVLRRRFPSGSIVGIGRDAERLHALHDELGVRIVRADLADSAAYAEALHGVTHVFHAAAVARFGNGPEFRADVRNTASLLACLKAEPTLQRLVYVSSIAATDRHPVEPNTRPIDEASRPYPTTDYGRAKLESEDLVRRSGLPAVIVRPAWVYGPGMRNDSHVRVFIEAIRRRAMYTWAWFPGRVPLIYIEDAVEAMLHLALGQRGLNETYILTDDEPVAFGQLFDLIDRIVLEREPKRVRVPQFLTRMARMAGHHLPFKAMVLFTDALWCSNRKLRESGYVLKTRVEEGLAAMRGNKSHDMAEDDVVACS